MNGTTRTTWLILILAPLALTPAALGQHAGDVWVGVTFQDQLAVSTDGFIPESNFAPLTPVSGLIHGWSNDDPGFDHVVTGTDVVPLEAGAEIWLEVVAVDAAFEAIDDGFQFLHDPGDDTFLGESTLHEHITWHINDQDPDFDENQCVWEATFVLRDDGSTVYATSAPFTMSFTNVPVRPAGTSADGDFDESGFADIGDMEALSLCAAGPDVMPDPDDPGVTTCVVECLNTFDFDDDRDVDLADYAEFQIEASN